ncbi:hypothetical protein L6R53_10590 [Myxococcota bacterium]|nr:hypothetical protein [Myxococcota bacterium]
MAPSALLLGDPERLPFAGHLRLVGLRQDAGIAVAARLGVGGLDDAALVPAFRAARALEARLERATAGAEPGRHALLHALWQALAEAPAAELGPSAGGDLCLLALAWDAQGQGVAGVGLGAVWGRSAAGVAPLVAPGHPLLAPPGRPASLPGVLDLDAGTLLSVIGAPSHLPAALPSLSELDRRCGVRS